VYVTDEIDEIEMGRHIPGRRCGASKDAADEQSAQRMVQPGGQFNFPALCRGPTPRRDRARGSPVASGFSLYAPAVPRRAAARNRRVTSGLVVSWIEIQKLQGRLEQVQHPSAAQAQTLYCSICSSR